MSTGFQDCKCVLRDGHWFISGDPHVLHRAFKIFLGATRAEGKIKIRATDEAARDILWFKSRYPMKVQPEVVLRVAAGRYVMAQKKRAAILAEGYKPQPVKFAEGESPRPYQVVAADLVKASHQLLLADGLGVGKAQPLDAKVLCIDGWQRMGSLIIGDTVVDPEGGYGVVTGIYDRGVMEVFEIRTNDGQVARCTDDHLWEVITKRDRAMGRRRVLPLREIRKKLRADCGHKQFRYGLPLVKPLPPVQRWRSEPKPYPIDPYVLGCLIGDGSLKVNSIMFSNADADVLDRFSSRLPSKVKLVHSQKYDYRVSAGNTGLKDRNPLVIALRKHELLGKRSYEKFLPDFVWQGTVEERKELLAGLLDTDGTADRQGKVIFASTSERLVDDTRRLVESLGGFATKTTRVTKFTYRGVKKQGRRSWQLYIRVPFNPFHQAKKRLRYRPPYMFRGIVSVESVGFEPVRCIRVTTKNNTYITDGTIVTHNTVSAIAAIADPAMRPALIVAPPALELQWKAQFKRFLPELSVHAVDSTTPYALNVIKFCQCGEKIDSRLHTKRNRLQCPKCNLPVHSGGRYPDVVLCSYTKLSNWADHLGRFAKMVVWEECHALRRSDSLKWKAAKTIADQVPVRMGLSGTPIYNYGGESWNVLECISPGFLGPKETFRETWCSGYTGMGKEPALSDPESFGAYLRSHGVMLRRTAEDVGIKLNAHQKITYPIQADASAFNAVSGRAAELARIILDDAKRQRGDSMRASGEFDNLMRQATALAKLPYVADFVELLLEQDIPVVLFAYHRQVYEALENRLRAWKPAFYTGTESPLQKDAAVTRFRNQDTSLFVCSLRSGEGLDGLQFRSCTNVFAELDWSPACMDQCCGRTYRDGQIHPVNSYFLVSDFGTDPIVSQVLGLKRDQSDGLMGSRNLGPVRKIDPTEALRQLAVKYLSGRR